MAFNGLEFLCSVSRRCDHPKHSQAVAKTRATARHCIFVFLNGGPAHLDTFDMKPDAPAEYRGPFEPIATTVPGLAQRARRFALLRALQHQAKNPVSSPMPIRAPTPSTSWSRNPATYRSRNEIDRLAGRIV